MSRRYDHFIKNQTKVKVVAKAENNTAVNTWLVVFAFAFTGFFFFFSDTLWRVMAGG